MSAGNGTRAVLECSSIARRNRHQDKEYVITMTDNMSEQDLSERDGLPVRDSGIWVKEKLYYLGRYLRIFSVGMKNKWAGRLYYVDLCAGPGRCLIRGTQE